MSAQAPNQQHDASLPPTHPKNEPAHSHPEIGQMQLQSQPELVHCTAPGWVAGSALAATEAPYKGRQMAASVVPR